MKDIETSFLIHDLGMYFLNKMSEKKLSVAHSIGILAFTVNLLLRSMASYAKIDYREVFEAFIDSLEPTNNDTSVN